MIREKKIVALFVIGLAFKYSRKYIWKWTFLVNKMSECEITPDKSLEMFLKPVSMQLECSVERKLSENNSVIIQMVNFG